jgi:purine-binding chemotaxis protein CheW
LSSSLNETVGILVNAVGDIISVDEDTIESLPPNLSDLDNEFISGVVKLENDLLVILKVDAIVKNDKKVNLQTSIS